MKMRPLIASLAVLALAACGGGGGAGDDDTDASPDPSTSAGGELEMSKVTVHSVQDPQLAAQLAVAAKMGFFEKYGLEVQAHYFPTGSAIAPGFVSGSVQIGIASSLAMVSVIASGFDAKLIGVVSEVSGGMGLVAKKSLGYDPKNLAGKKLGIIDAPPTKVMLANFAEQSQELGLDFADVQLVNFQDPATMQTAFANGDLDAIAIWNPTFLNATQFGNILFSGSVSYLPDGEAHDWDLFAVPIGIYTTTDFSEKNPNTLVAILQGLNDATNYINENPDELTAVLVDLLHTPEDLTANMVAQNSYMMTVDQELVDNLRDQTNFLFENKVLSENPDPADYLDLSFLSQVDPSLATAE